MLFCFLHNHPHVNGGSSCPSNLSSPYSSLLASLWAAGSGGKASSAPRQSRVREYQMSTLPTVSGKASITTSNKTAWFRHSGSFPSTEAVTSLSRYALAVTAHPLSTTFMFAAGHENSRRANSSKFEDFRRRSPSNTFSSSTDRQQPVHSAVA